MPGDSSAPKGLIGNVEQLYETLILRDLLGYALPGGALLLGLAAFLGWCPSWNCGTWVHLVAALAVFYATGFALRLLGTVIPILVISTDRPGILGDPWELQPEQPRRWWHWPWRSHHDTSITQIARMMLKADVASIASLQRTLRRESMFLHIGGNLGLALLILSIVFGVDLLVHYQMLPRQWGSCIAFLTTTSRQVVFVIVLLLASVVLILGNYIHARVIRLLLRSFYFQ